MRNIKGNNGIINIYGTPGAPSHMTTASDPEFWEYIEDGIKPLVKVLVKHNITTFGSCQGHQGPGYSSIANVRYYVFDNRINAVIKQSINSFQDPNVSYNNAMPEKLIGSSDSGNKYATARIRFLIKADKRKELDSLIKKYSEYLDTCLTKFQITENSSIKKK